MFILSGSFSCFCASIFTLNIVLVQNEGLRYRDFFDFRKNVFEKSTQEFTKDLFQNVMKQYPGENLVISPVSAYTALLMVHLGAGEETRNRLNEVMKLSPKFKNIAKLHQQFGDVLNDVQNKTETAGQEVTSTEVIIANGFFMQQDHPVIGSFIQSLTEFYNSSVISLDFKSNARQATNTINSWILKATRNRISNFYPSPLKSDTVAILASAIYFNGKWKTPFSKRQTRTEIFNTENAEMDVRMMQEQNTVRYQSSDSLQFDSIELIYEGDKFSMIIVLPRPSQSLKNLTNHWHLLDREELGRNTRMAEVHYKIPKMKFSWKNSLVEALQLKDTFKNADLSSMTTDSRVLISDLSQAAEIQVNEEGTTASAVSNVEFDLRLATMFTPSEGIEFYVNRPFMFCITHRSRNVELFTGVVYNPL